MIWPVLGARECSRSAWLPFDWQRIYGRQGADSISRSFKDRKYAWLHPETSGRPLSTLRSRDQRDPHQRAREIGLFQIVKTRHDHFGRTCLCFAHGCQRLELFQQNDAESLQKISGYVQWSFSAPAAAKRHTLIYPSSSGRAIFPSTARAFVQVSVAGMSSR